MPKILPEGERVIIDPDESEEQIGVILIPQSVREKQNQAMQTGTVVAVGPSADTLFEDPDWEDENGDHRRPVRPGDKVYFKKYAQYVFSVGDRHNSKDYWIINDRDIIGVGHEG